MKKILTLFLLLTLLTLCSTSCGSEPITHSAVVEGAIFGGKNDDKIAVEIKFNPDWITTANNQKYNPDLAQFCAMLSTDSYFREKDVAKGTQNRVLLSENDGKEYTMSALPEAFGFTDAEHYESFKVLEDPTDSDDSVTLNIGHQTVNDRDVFVVVVRGTFSWQEWSSSFDPGFAAENYEKMTGVHPDWTHKENQKGIDIAANRAINFITEYMGKHNDASKKDTILITGHSRGGTIANLLGAHFENEKDIKSYTYTFNAVPAAGAKDAGNYRTIFNIFDQNDFFTDLFPFAEKCFVRYGTDMTLSVAASDVLKAKLAGLLGREDFTCMTDAALQEYRRLFAERFPNREALSEIKTVVKTYDDEESAMAGLESINTMISTAAGLAIENLTTVSEITEANGKYTVTVTYCGMALLRSYARILAYGSAANDAVAALFADDTLGCQIAALITENSSAINGGHLMAVSTLIAGEVK